MSRGLFVCVMVSLVTSGLAISVGSFALTPERAIGLVLLVLMGIDLLGRRGSSTEDRVIYLWLAWNFVLLVSALFTSDVVAHIPALVLSFIPTAVFWLVVRQQYRNAFVFDVTMWILWINGAIGCVALLLHLSGAIKLPFFFDDIGRLKLLISEPNIFGSTIGLLIILTLSRIRPSVTTAALAGMTAIVFIACGSKMPYLAFVVCIALYGVFRAVANQRGLGASVVMPLWLGGFLLAVGIAFAPQVENTYSKSLAREGTYEVRTYLIRVGIRRFEEKPIIGTGPGDLQLQSLKLLKQYGAKRKETLWIPNVFIAILHDSGIVGLLIYALFLLRVIWIGLQRVAQGSIDHCGYLAGFLFIVLCSQASSVHLNIIFGLSAGLVLLRPAVRVRGSALAFANTA